MSLQSFRLSLRFLLPESLGCWHAKASGNAPKSPVHLPQGPVHVAEVLDMLIGRLRGGEA